MINEEYIINDKLVPSLDIFKSNPSKFKDAFQKKIINQLDKAHDTVSRSDAVVAILFTIFWMNFSPLLTPTYGLCGLLLFDIFFLTIVFYILDRKRETRSKILSGVLSGINQFRQDLKKKLVNATGKEKSFINQVLKKIDEGQKDLETKVAASFAGGR